MNKGCYACSHCEIVRGKPYPLSELRRSIEGNGIQLSFDEMCDIGGCGCFVEDDEE